MIARKKHLDNLGHLLKNNPIVGLIGARQVGKTTLARVFVEQQEEEVAFFDLENPEDKARLQDPMVALRDLTGLIVIDEVQHAPEIFPVLRVLADRTDNFAKFLILGSASPDLLRQSSETLAGRIAYYTLPGFSLEEVGRDSFESLWLRGRFPRSFLASSNEASMTWRVNFIRTFLERDLPALGVTTATTTMQRFWRMLAHYHGQTWNASEFARSFGVADTTVRGYLDTLTSALVVRQLSPWQANVKKRQVKAPKVYLIDSGLLHALLNLPQSKDLEAHPKVGASWEGFIINEIIQHLGAEANECFFWATHAGAELDLLVVRGATRLGFEVKRSSSPSKTRSMDSALKDLKLDVLYVIHAGQKTFPINEEITAISYLNLLEDLPSLTRQGKF